MDITLKKENYKILQTIKDNSIFGLSKKNYAKKKESLTR